MRRCLSRYYLTYGALTIGTIVFLFLQLEQVDRIQGNSSSALNIEEKGEGRQRLEEPIQEDNFTRTMRERQDVMRAACRQEGLDREGKDILHQINPWEFLINWEYNLVWCNVFKSASSSWMYIFNVLSGYSQEFLDKSRGVPLQLARDKYPRPSVKELSRALSLTNVTSIIVGR